MTQYIQLIAKLDTWYKAGTEVFWEGTKADGWTARRLTAVEWQERRKPEHGGIGCVGIRVCEDNSNERGNGWAPGFERVDGEWCNPDEFEARVVDEPKECDL